MGHFSMDAARAYKGTIGIILGTVLIIMNPLPPDEESLGKTERKAQKDCPSPSMGEGLGEGEKTIGPSFYRGRARVRR